MTHVLAARRGAARRARDRSTAAVATRATRVRTRASEQNAMGEGGGLANDRGRDRATIVDPTVDRASCGRRWATTHRGARHDARERRGTETAKTDRGKPTTRTTNQPTDRPSERASERQTNERTSRPADRPTKLARLHEPHEPSERARARDRTNRSSEPSERARPDEPRRAAARAAVRARAARARRAPSGRPRGLASG